MTFIQERKKNVGANRYNKTNKDKHITGNKSYTNEKNKNSDTKNIDPGKPRKISEFTRHIKNNLLHIKLTPLISVISLVLNRLAIASTNRKELVERSAWLINIQKLDSISCDCPLTTHIVNQCISTTVEYATSFFKSIW